MARVYNTIEQTAPGRGTVSEEATPTQGLNKQATSLYSSNKSLKNPFYAQQAQQQLTPEGKPAIAGATNVASKAVPVLSAVTGAYDIQQSLGTKHGKEAITSGAAQGAMKGAVFGPVGIVAGAVIGGAIGAMAKSPSIHLYDPQEVLKSAKMEGSPLYKQLGLEGLSDQQALAVIQKAKDAGLLQGGTKADWGEMQKGNVVFEDQTSHDYQVDVASMMYSGNLGVALSGYKEGGSARQYTSRTGGKAITEITEADLKTPSDWKMYKQKIKPLQDHIATLKSGGNGDIAVGGGSPPHEVPAKQNGINVKGVTLYKASETEMSSVANFGKNLGYVSDAAPTTVTQGAMKKYSTSASTVLSQMGLTSTPTQNAIPLATMANGTTLYSEPNIAASQDVNTGKNIVNNLTKAIEPFGALNPKEMESLSGLGNKVSDTKLISKLDGLMKNGDTSGFVDTFLKQNGKKGVASVTPDEVSQGGESSLHAYDAHEISQVWNKLSPAQKSLALSSTAIKGHTTETGESIWTKELPGTGINGTPSLKMGQAMGLISKGVNAYGLAKGWQQISDVAYLSSGGNSPPQMIKTAMEHGLLGGGTTGAASPVNEAEVASQGWALNPAIGVGAITSSKGASIPKGYVKVPMGGDSQLAVPESLIDTVKPYFEVAGAAKNGDVSALKVGDGAKGIYTSWSKEGKAKEAASTLGGSGALAGILKLTKTNPQLGGGILTASTFKNLSGKGADVSKADLAGPTATFKKVGLLNKNGDVTLPDGTTYPLNATVPLDLNKPSHFVAGMAGVSLSRLVNGDKGLNVDLAGAKLGEIALSNIPTSGGKTGAVKALQSNLKSLYSNAGIKSKVEAYALSNQAYAEGRINEGDLVSAQKAASFIYDANGSQAIAPLMSGATWAVKNSLANIPAETDRPGKKISVVSKPVAPKEAMPQVAQGAPSPEQGMPEEAPLPRPTTPKNRIKGKDRLKLMNVTKEQAALKNQEEFGAM